MTIEAIALALDGVLFDLEDAHLESCNAALEQYGLHQRWSASQWRQAMWIHGGAHAIVAATASAARPIKDADIRRLVAEKEKLLRAAITARRPEPNAECMALIEQAREQGAKLAVITDLSAVTASMLLDTAFGENTTSVLSVVVSGADFALKTGGNPYSLAARTLGVEAEDCVAIDATAPALNAARLAGIQTFSVHDDGLERFALRLVAQPAYRTLHARAVPEENSV